jgi:hypothetical protein
MLASIGTISKPSWVWVVCKLTSTVNAYVLDGQTANTLAFRQAGGNGIVSINSTTSLTWSAANANVAQAYGLTYGTGGSIVSNGAVEVTGTSGTTSSTGLTIGAAGNTTASADCQIEEIVVSTTPPAANFLSAYSQARYGFG